MSWSYTALSTWEQCAAKYKFRYVDHIPDVSTAAAQRGTDRHAVVERYLKEDGAPLAPGLEGALHLLNRLKEKTIAVEQKIALSDKWKPVEWKEGWVKCVIDASELPENGTLNMWEWKTGKAWPEHPKQRELYGLVGLSMYAPEEVGRTQVNGYYLDDHTMAVDVVHRLDEDRLKKEWTDRAAIMEGDTIYAPRPGFYCRWCPYARSKGGPCRFS